ncbi:MAG: 1-pyrroline-5-carboxylate dehydrogenase [Gemmatimonadetes bacterium]|nr:MAG: 1-pyrroline-5-carboxylate dehydrogenase [Gemmatimonadetes bacterium 13_1_40CM_3_66_12]PYP95965.1 MAG: 1-pyrroline-5-carboxylate dehydrogenase [Gemmatimonadota bacterium]
MNAAKIPTPINEPVFPYAPGSRERGELKQALKDLSGRQIEIPVVIGGKEIRTGKTVDAVMPHCHRHVLAKVHQAGPEEVAGAINAARDAWREWSSWSFADRAAVFLKAADLLATRWRAMVNAATMLGQSKTAFQAEIDAACELIDFWRFNVHYAERIHAEQPLSVAGSGMWNAMDYRGLEGFVYAITPFNFTAIGGNLPTSPAMMGCTVVWKPAATASYSNYLVFRLLQEAGLPPGVINFVPGPAAVISERLLADRHLGGIHFTGSTEVFQTLWKQVATNLTSYADYPRLVGETGGKDFILAHASADVDALATGIVRGAFEYQGQKCSAASRAYIPESLWPKLRDRVLGLLTDVRVGDPADFRNFMAAVIDRKSFDKIKGYIERARNDTKAKILFGGECDDADGYFVHPTLIQVEDPAYRTMCEEIFGPVLSLYVYPDKKWKETLELVDRTSPYALTGAVFSQDRAVLAEASSALRYSAGNFYLNDKPTGAVVGQQPFGGGRASGTNDKAGSLLNLIRWTSARAVKENFVPPRDPWYPFMAEA